MNTRKYKSNPNELLRQGKNIMLLSDNTKYYFRVYSVNLVLNGMAASEVAEIAGVSRSTVSGWVKAVDEHGFEALKTVKQSGRPPKLSEKKKVEIDAAIQNNPANYGIKIWDGPSLSAYIQEKYNIKISGRQCQRLFHELGYSKIRPQTFPSKDHENTEAREEFKKKRFSDK